MGGLDRDKGNGKRRLGQKSKARNMSEPSSDRHAMQRRPPTPGSQLPAPGQPPTRPLFRISPFPLDAPPPAPRPRPSVHPGPPPASLLPVPRGPTLRPAALLHALVLGAPGRSALGRHLSPPSGRPMGARQMLAAISLHAPPAARWALTLGVWIRNPSRTATCTPLAYGPPRTWPGIRGAVYLGDASSWVLPPPTGGPRGMHPPPYLPPAVILRVASCTENLGSGPLSGCGTPGRDSHPVGFLPFASIEAPTTQPAPAELRGCTRKGP